MTRPDGSTVTTPSEPSDPSRAATIVDGSLVAILEVNPQPGDWRIDVDSAYTGSLDFGFYFSSFPSADGPAVMDATLSKMADQDAAKLLSSLAGLESVGCFWCKVGCYALGIVIAAAATIGISIVTAGAAPACIAALAVFLGISSAAAGLLVAGVISVVASSAAIAASYICSWAGVCDAPSMLAAHSA